MNILNEINRTVTLVHRSYGML